MAWIVLFALAALLNFIAQNYGNDLIFKGLSTEAGASLAVALAGICIAKKTFTAGLTPILIYRGRPQKTGQMLKGSNVWVTELINTGPGTAVIRNVRFYLQNARIKTETELQTSLAQYKLRPGRDYVFQKLSENTALGPQNSLLLAEISFPKIKHFKDLYVEIEYVDLTGQSFRKKIQLVPKKSS